MLYKEFDAATTPIEGRMLLEASAGTGKNVFLDASAAQAFSRERNRTRSYFGRDIHECSH